MIFQPLFLARMGAQSFTETEPPADIQFMPPGKHRCVFTDGDGKPKPGTVEITAKTADVLAKDFSRLSDLATQGKGDKPFFDFDHQDHGASGHPTELYWGGDDPIKGGVRAKVEWTAGGASAVKGKEYRRFSPGFLMDEKGNIFGLPVNMGGLVNKAAFKAIAPLWSKDAQATHDNDMADETNQELERLRKENSELKAKASGAETSARIVSIEAELEEQKRVNAELKAKAVKAEAGAAVADAVRLGKIAGKDTAAITRWTEAYAKDPETTKGLLDAMPKSHVLGEITPRGATAVTAGAPEAEHELVTKAKEMSKDGKVTFVAALDGLARTSPALYQDYRETLGAH